MIVRLTYTEPTDGRQYAGVVGVLPALERKLIDAVELQYTKHKIHDPATAYGVGVAIFPSEATLKAEQARYEWIEVFSLTYRCAGDTGTRMLIASSSVLEILGADVWRQEMTAFRGPPKTYAVVCKTTAE